MREQFLTEMHKNISIKKDIKGKRTWVRVCLEYSPIRKVIKIPGKESTRGENYGSSSEMELNAKLWL